MDLWVGAVFNGSRITVPDTLHRQFHVGLPGGQPDLTHINFFQTEAFSGPALHRHGKRASGTQMTQIQIKSSAPVGCPAGKTVLQPYRNCLARIGKS